MEARHRFRFPSAREREMAIFISVGGEVVMRALSVESASVYTYT